MTMDLIGKHGDTSFTHQGWSLLIELALKYGWQPAGAIEPEEEGDIEESGQVLRLTEEELEQFRVPSDHPLVQAVQSLFFQSSDPVLNSYFNNAGFVVTSQDARALAEALEQALPDLPNHEALAHKAVTMASAPGELFLSPGTPINPFEWFSGKNKTYLTAFIDFCRQGGFEIW